MYNRKERKSVAFSYELASYENKSTQSSYVQDAKSLAFFKESTAAHLAYCAPRLEAAKYNIELIESEIEYVKTAGVAYEKECQAKLDLFQKFIKDNFSGSNVQFSISNPVFSKFAGDLNSAQLITLLEAELASEKENQSKHELRIKILNHNIKTVADLYETK